jgi:hypothetical protein
MRAGVINTDVCALHTPAELPLASILWDGELESKESIEQGVINTFPVMNPIILQVKWFGAGEDFKTEVSCYLCEGRTEFGDLVLVLMHIDDPDVLLSLQVSYGYACFSIDVEEADNAAMTEPTQCPGNLHKMDFMVGQIGQVTQNNRIVSPDDFLRPHLLAEFPEPTDLSG